MTNQEQNEKIVYGSLITSTKCYNCIHFPLCFEQKGGVNLELASENCCYYQSKLPENRVMLSKEEYEELKLELAQKIYDDIFAILKIKLWLYGDDSMTKNLNGLTKQKILDFTKKWGIKNNHLNEKDYSHIDHLQAHDKQIKEQVIKETAEKIYLQSKAIVDATKHIVQGREYIHIDALKEIIKNCGGEIEE